MKKLIVAGATDQTLDIFIQNSSSTTGAGLTGLVFNTASLVCYYRKGATGSATALTLATQTVGGAHSDGGFVEIDATNMPGMYRLDLSDTIVATAGTVTMMLKGATNMAPLTIELQVGATNFEGGVVPTVTTATTATNLTNLPTIPANWLTAAGTAADFTTEIQSGLATASDLATVAGYIDTEIATIISELAKVPKSDGTVTLNATVLAAIADALLDRNMATGTDSGSASVRTMRQALRFLRNKWSISGTTLTVTKEDDTTTTWTSEITGTAGADPITASDPAS